MCVLDIHVGDLGQVAYAAGYGYVILVFDCLGLCATAYTGVAILGIGHEGDKKTKD